ncbi:MAG: sugar phosphate isomerase/epimerase [Sedimentisphaerales bacterium]|nr:sugar phosphate isomerase/epimerase [Sedimentisphaerales bacterium]
MAKAINRRTLLKGITTASISASALTGFGVQAQEKASNKNDSPDRWKTAVGLNGFESVRSYGYKMELDDVLEFIQACGFDGVELVDWPRPYPRTQTEARALKARYDALGLEIVTLQGRGMDGNCGSPDAASRQRYLTHLKHQVDLLHGWGCKFIALWSGGPAGPGAEEYCKWTADTWAKLTEYAGRFGMYVTTEPEPVMAVHTYELLHKLVDWINLPNFYVTFDPSHSTILGGGDPMTFLREFRGRVGHVHFTDTDGTLRDGDGTSKHLTLGDGKLDLLSLLTELKVQDYDKWIMLDLWRLPDIYRGAYQGKKKLDAMLDRLFDGFSLSVSSREDV